MRLSETGRRLTGWGTTAVVVLVVADIILVWTGLARSRDAADAVRGADTVRASSDERPGGAGAVLDTARTVMLSVAADGTVARAVRGTCRAAGRLDVGGDYGADLDDVLPKGATQVLSVRAGSSSSLEVVAADGSCSPRALRSANGGDTWVAFDVNDAWYLDPSDPGRVHGPDGAATLPCTVVGLDIVNSTQARATCDGGQVQGSANGGRSWITLGTLDGAVSTSFPSPSLGVAIRTEASCQNAVYASRDAARTWTRRGCIDGAQPRAVAFNGTRVVAQVDDALRVSPDGGKTWARP